MHVRRWITFHGFALNVQPDLRGFDLIVPCGIEGVDMTSIARELAQADRASAMEPEAAYLGAADLWAATRDAVVSAFAQAFDRSPRRRAGRSSRPHREAGTSHGVTAFERYLVTRKTR